MNQCERCQGQSERPVSLATLNYQYVVHGDLVAPNSALDSDKHAQAPADLVQHTFGLPGCATHMLPVINPHYMNSGLHPMSISSIPCPRVQLHVSTLLTKNFCLKVQCGVMHTNSQFCGKQPPKDPKSTQG